MPTSGVVLTLSSDWRRSATLLRELRADPRFTVGKPQGRHVPLVLEAETLSRAAEIFDDLGRREGVLHVDLVMSFADDCEPFEGSA